MKNLVLKIRRMYFRFLGVDYAHLLKSIDFRYLHEDSFTEIGEKTYHNGAKVFRWSRSRLSIGKYCSIACDVKFIVDDGYHQYSQITNYPLINNLFDEKELVFNKKKEMVLCASIKKQDISVGNDVWIGANSIILPGVSIGNGVTIAAGSIVTRSFGDYCVIGGNPARIISFKCSEKEAEHMNEISWWNWPNEKIKLAIDDFTNLSIANFIVKYRK